LGWNNQTPKNVNVNANMMRNPRKERIWERKKGGKNEFFCQSVGFPPVLPSVHPIITDTSGRVLPRTQLSGENGEELMLIDNR
jgi:hypothetical protein